MNTLPVRSIAAALCFLSTFAAAQQPATLAINDRFGGAAAAQAAAVAGTVLAGASSPSVTALPELPTEGYWIENAPINEVFQYLARKCDRQYFFNNELAAPQFNVTGHLKLDQPQQQMEELAVAYGLTVYEKGTTIYLMNDAQLSRLPVEVMCYTLKYLRGAQPMPAVSSQGGGGGGGGSHEGGEGGGGGGQTEPGQTDFEKLKGIIKPMLTRDVGQIEFEEKTNVLLVTDNTVRLQKVRQLLEQIDRPKQQIVINVRILRVRNSHGSKVGVDWTGILGNGLPIKASQSLNALFNLPNASTLTKTLDTTRSLSSSFNRLVDTVGNASTITSSATTAGGMTYDAATSSARDYTDGAGLVFQAAEMEAIVHALNQRDIVSQEACPTIITEDNEQGIISIVDRFPVITSNVTATSAGQTITDEVRYKIDESDPNSTEQPQKSREIGVTLSVTPTLLPDGTVRMRLRPRVANIVDLVPGKSGNVFPRVSESTIEGISRIPNGQSLFLGGFYDSSDNYKNNKVPVLGSLPLLNRLFSYKDKGNEQISLVFIITPRVYDATSPADVPYVNQRVGMNSGFNRVNPDATATPQLPDALPENGYLPVPSGFEDAEGREARRRSDSVKKKTWLGRLLSRDEPAALPVTHTSTR